MITMKEIAREAGVSQPAVSLVLNGRGPTSRISATTREKVLAAAERLGYRRNELARSMKTGRTHIIGIVGGLGSGYSLEIIKGIGEAAAAGGYTLKLLPANTPEQMVTVCRQCLEQRLDGIIVRAVSAETMAVMRRELEPHRLPMVFVGNIAVPAGLPCVYSDDSHGAAEAVKFLHRLGHRRMALLEGQVFPNTMPRRRDGYLAAMAELGLDDSRLRLELAADLPSARQVEEIVAFLRRERPSAVFCSSDFLAMRTLQAASGLGRRVPEELSVVGFGDLDCAELGNPPLTTVRQPFAGMGRTAAARLIDLIAGNAVRPETALPVELVIRESTTLLKLNRERKTDQ